MKTQKLALLARTKKLALLACTKKLALLSVLGALGLAGAAMTVASTREGTISSSGFKAPSGNLICESIAKVVDRRYAVVVRNYHANPMISLSDISAETPITLLANAPAQMNLHPFDGRPYLVFHTKDLYLYVPANPAPGDDADFEAKVDGKPLLGDLSCRWTE